MSRIVSYRIMLSYGREKGTSCSPPTLFRPVAICATGTENSNISLTSLTRSCTASISASSPALMTSLTKNGTVTTPSKLVVTVSSSAKASFPPACAMRDVWTALDATQKSKETPKTRG